MENLKTDNLLKIPGVGKNIARHLREIGITCVADLKGKDPENYTNRIV